MLCKFLLFCTDFFAIILHGHFRPQFNVTKAKQSAAENLLDDSILRDRFRCTVHVRNIVERIKSDS